MHEETLALARHRMERAEAMFISCQRDLLAEDYASANNRAYYCIFHAMRAVLALDSLDFKKHSAVIATFHQLYIKPGYFSRFTATLITNAELIRNRSDYMDYYICSSEETHRLIEGAERFLEDVKRFVDESTSIPH